VADDDAVGSDEDFADDGAQHTLAVLDAGVVGAFAQPGEEAVEVLGEFEVGVVVDELGVERVDLSADGGFAFA
jgi:hypothetical protein